MYCFSFCVIVTLCMCTCPMLKRVLYACPRNTYWTGLVIGNTYLLLTRSFGLNISVVRFCPMPLEKMCFLVRQAGSVLWALFVRFLICSLILPAGCVLRALLLHYLHLLSENSRRALLTCAPMIPDFTRSCTSCIVLPDSSICIYLRTFVMHLRQVPSGTSLLLPRNELHVPWLEVVWKLLVFVCYSEFM